MIEKLTKKQEKQLDKFKDECLQIGLSTEPIDKKAIDDNIEFVYKNYLGVNKKPYIWYCDSPIIFNLVLAVLFKTDILKDNLESKLESNLWSNLEANLRSDLRSKLESNLWSNLEANLRSDLRSNLGANLWSNLRSDLESNLRSDLESNLRSNLGANLWADLWSNLEANLRSNLWSNLEANLRSDLRSKLESNLGANLWADLWSDLRSNLGANLGANLWSNLRSDLGKILKETFQNIYWSNLDIYWLSFYLYPEKYLGIDYKEKSEDLKIVSTLFKAGGFFWFYKDICFVSERCKTIKKKGIRLHCDNGPAIEYRCGWKIYYLNGVCVPENLVLTPANDLDCKLILSEKNADIKREIVRKIGVDRICANLGAKTIDRQNEYELITIDIGDNRQRPYLKMLNCNTVEKALTWRNGTSEKPIILT
jgi:hypothetical protein